MPVTAPGGGSAPCANLSPTAQEDDPVAAFELLVEIGTPEALAFLRSIASDNQSNILLSRNAEVYVTMLHGGAGYTFAAGSRIGFFVASDGWTGDPLDPVEINWKGIYYSLRNLNAETDEALRAHFVLLYEEDAGGGKKVVLGAEDIKRTLNGCDHDFNDVVFLVTTDPDDGDRAFYAYSPAEGTVGTLAYEDLWPLRGDFDFNDLVVWYSFANVTDAELFGTGDDRSNPAESFYYRTDNNLPWAIHLSILWSHPAEKNDIVLAYPKLVGWAQSGGTSNQDWYLPAYAKIDYIYAP